MKSGKVDTAVIMAGGNSERCHPLTMTRPKPLLEVAGSTILEYTLGQLQSLVKDVIVVVGYKGDMIRERFGNSFGSLRLTYVAQEKQAGTANALLAAEPLLKGRFLAMNGDDLYHRDDLARLLALESGLLAMEHVHPERFGVVQLREGGKGKARGEIAAGIVEKPSPAAKSGNLVSVGAYVIDPSIFTFLKKTSRSSRGEYELTSAITAYCAERETAVARVEHYWIPIGYPWDLLAANAALLDRMKSKNSGEIEPGVMVKGTLVVGEGSLVKAGTYIEGPVYIGKNCVVGPNAFLREHTTLGDGCKVGQAVELKNTILFSGAKVPHLSYVGDSVLGCDVNLGAGTITGNLRHDHANVKSMMKGELVDSGQRKLGTVIGDGAKTGIDTMIYPGRKIWPGKFTLPGEAVQKDIE